MLGNGRYEWRKIRIAFKYGYNCFLHLYAQRTLINLISDEKRRTKVCANLEQYNLHNLQLYKELISQIAVAIWLNFKEMPTEACVLFNLSSIVLIFHSKYSNVLNFRLKDLHVLLRKKCLLRNRLKPISILWKSFRFSDYEYILERYVNICESSAFIIVYVCECHVYFQGKSMWKCTHI